jgi:hypothetical protein
MSCVQTLATEARPAGRGEPNRRPHVAAAIAKIKTPDGERLRQDTAKLFRRSIRPRNIAAIRPAG